MRLTQVIVLTGTHAEMAAITIRIVNTTSGEPLAHPLTGQLLTFLGPRFAQRQCIAAEAQG